MTDRRTFLMKSGLLAAGSALGALSFPGCTYEIAIPCLGPAAPPSEGPGMTYITASAIGCALDCDLSTGRNKYTGGTATDDGPRINAAMAKASASNPMTLIIDGSALISGLFLPAGGYWSIAGLGCGTGFFLKSGTNNDGIHNGSPTAAIPSDPGPPPPPRGQNVSLSNFTINANGGNGRDGDSTTGIPQGVNGKVWYFGINLMNLNNLLIQNIVVVNSPAFQIRLSNVGNVTVEGCVLQSSGVNRDGLHFDGPANDISISNCQIICDDDGIALNCPEGYTGDISHVTVTNCSFQTLTVMRLYTIDGNGNPAKFNIKNVSVSHCTGQVNLAGFAIGQGSGSNPNSVADLTVTDCTLTAPGILDLTANFGEVLLRNVIQNYMSWSDFPGTAFVRSSPIYGNCTYAGSSLTLENCKVAAGDGTNAPALVLENGSTIANLILSGFSTHAKELINAASGTVGTLTINSVDRNHINQPISPEGFASIGSVNGTGVLATQWEFPDAVMANNVPYISANSGKPSIKINGVVEPYTGP